MKHIFFFALVSCICLVGCTTQGDDKKTNKPSVYFVGSELKIVAEIYLKPDASRSMKPIFEKLIAGSQAEEGCLYYDLHQDVADTTSVKYVMIEVWKDQEAIDSHNNSAHFKNFAKVAQDYIDSMKISTLVVSK